MKLTIGKKLVVSFLLLAFLVLLSGVVGILILNKVSHSTDLVVKGKVPILYSAMKAGKAVAKTEKNAGEYAHSFTKLAQQRKAIEEQFDELDLWLAMLEYGTNSSEFAQSHSFELYKSLKLTIKVPKASPKIIKRLHEIKSEVAAFRRGCTNFMAAHDEYLSYSITREGKNYDMPSYLLILQRDYIDWYRSVKDAVNIVTVFKGNTDPVKGSLGSWLHSYKVKDKGLNKLIHKMDKYYRKVLKYVIKINQETASKGKMKQLSRSGGASSRIEQYFDKIRKYIAPVYQKLELDKDTKYRILVKSANKINQGFEELVKLAETEMADAALKSESSKKSGTIYLLILTLVAVGIALILGLYISRYLTKNIIKLAKTTNLIASGDLRNRVEVSSADELGDLARGTNAMTDNLKEVIGKIKSFSAQLATSSSSLAEISTSMTENTRIVVSKSESVAVASEEMSTNMKSVESLSGNAVANTKSVSVATNEINTSIVEISQNVATGNSITRDAVERAESATQKVNELGTAAQEIDKVTEVITQISKQTNLLALNATIEAARAGEAGKGFAVVASEIKQLALKTTDATNDIKERIDKIQDSTSDTVQEIEGVAQIIEKIDQIVSTIAAAVEEQSVTTRKIAGNMEQATAGLQDVSENVTQSTSVASNIAKDISDVNSNSTEVLQNSDAVNTNSDELKTLAGDLQQIVSQFKL